MFWRYPTGLVVLWIVFIALLVLAALELLIRPARTTTAEDSGTKEGSGSTPVPSA